MKKSSIIFVRVLIVFFLLALTIPFAYGIFQAFPVLDDFDHAIGSWNVNVSETAFKKALSFANEQYMTWSGTWLLIFFENLLSPLHFGEYSSRVYGVFTLVIFILFVGAWLWSVYTIISELGFRRQAELVDDRFGILPEIGNTMGTRIASGSGYIRTNGKKRLGSESYAGTMIFAVSVLSLAALLLNNFYPETTTMFNGAMQYKVPAIFGMLSIAFMTRYFGDDHYNGGSSTHDRDGVLMTVFGILACMQLSWCIPIGGIYLYFWIRDFWTEEGIHPLRLVPLGLFVVSGLSIVLAPGQRARAGIAGNGAIAGASTDGFGMTILKTLWHTTVAWAGQIKSMFTNPVMIGIFVIILVLGISVSETNAKNPNGVGFNIFRLVLIAFASWGVALPACFGYGNSGLPNRLMFSVDLSIVIGFSYFMFKLGQQMSQYFDLEVISRFRVWIYTVLILFVGTISVVNGTYTSNPWYVSAVKSKNVHRERMYWIGVMDEITLKTPDAIKEAKKTGEVSRIFVERSVLEYTPTGVFVEPVLTEDGTWPNASMARFLCDSEQVNVSYIIKEKVQ